MSVSKKELTDFLSEESKKQGEYVSAEVALYPTEGVFWFDSGYLDTDDLERKFLKVEGRLIYRGLSIEGKEKYLMRGRLGSFQLKKEGGRLLVTDYFTPKPGPL